MPRLIDELKSTDANIRAKSIATHGTLGPFAQSADNAAATAVRVLGKIGPQAKSAVAALKMLLAASLKDEDHPVNPRSILQSLKKIDASADIMPILMEGLNSADPDRRKTPRTWCAGSAPKGGRRK